MAVIDRNMKPSEIFLGLWRQWARTEKSGVEDFTVCAEAWAEIRRMERWMEEKEAEERRFFENLAVTPVDKILRCAQDDKEPEDAGGASPSPTETEERGPSGTPAPTEDADGVQSGPEEPDPEAGMSSWMRRRLRIQKRVLATRFSTQQIADASEKQLTVAEIRAFCDSYAALQGGKLKYLEEAMDKLEGKT